MVIDNRGVTCRYGGERVQNDVISTVTSSQFLFGPLRKSKTSSFA